MPDPSPQADIYSPGSPAKRRVHRAGIVAAAVASVFLVTVLVMILFPRFRSPPFAAAMAASWFIGAPLWFWKEYFFIYRAAGGGLPESFEHFKYGQQVAAAIWAGFSAVLGAFALSDFSKPEPAEYKCSISVPATAFSASGVTASAPVHVSLQDAHLTCRR